jgi:hypothetical protein
MSSIQQVTNAGAKLLIWEFGDDADISEGAKMLNAFGFGAADVVDEYADLLFTALYYHDMSIGKKSRRRPERVVKPLRSYAATLRNVHRYSLRNVQQYRKEYSEDIARNSSHGKRTFRPGERAA